MKALIVSCVTAIVFGTPLLADAQQKPDIIRGCEAALIKTGESSKSVEIILQDAMQTKASYKDICARISQKLQKQYANKSKAKPYKPGLDGVTMTSETGEKSVVGLGLIIDVMGEQFSDPQIFTSQPDDNQRQKYGMGCFRYIMSSNEKDINIGFVVGHHISFQTGRYKLMPSAANKYDLMECLAQNPNPFCYLDTCPNAYKVMKRE